MQLDSSAFVTDPDIVQRLQGLSSAVRCDQDRVLFRQGESPTGLYILHEGAANLTTRSRDGKFAICLQTTAATLLGMPSVFSRQPHSFTAVARQGALLSFINSDELSGLIHSDPPLHLKVLHTLAAEAEFARMTILDQVCVGAEIAVAAA